MPTFTFVPIIVDANGTTAQMVITDTTDNIGARLYTHLSAPVGVMSSFVNSLNTSANDWSRPYGPTRFGPSRS